MQVGFRYHIATLIAVFFALLIGILVGVTLVGNPALEKQIAHLRLDFDKIRKQLRLLEARQKTGESFAKSVIPTLVEDRLSGRRVAIILSHEFDDTEMVEEISATLEQSGAVVTSISTVLPAFVHLDAETADRIATRQQLSRSQGSDLRKELASRFAVRLVYGISHFSFYLRKAGLLRLSGNYELPVRRIVLVGGLDQEEDGAVDAIDLPIINALQQAGAEVVGCESIAAPISTIRIYQRENISTVDNADTPVGQLALVLALAGKQGNFGVKPTADHLLPSLE